MTAKPGHSAFTLVELIVVVAVIAILIAAIVGVSTSVIRGGKERDTGAMLQLLDLAVKEFRDDAPLAKVTHYKSRYVENCPPDELEAFTDEFTTPSVPPFLRIAPGGTANALKDIGDGNLDLTTVKARSTKAMALAITLYSDEADAIIERIDARFRKSTGGSEYLDRQVGAGSKIKQPLTYFVDSWGTPVEYFSTNDPCTTCTTALTDQPPTVILQDARRDTSASLVKANNGEPLFVSYGADGPDQFSPDFLDADGLPFDMVKDWIEYNGDATNTTRRIDHRLNTDNVYSNPEIAERLAAGGT